MNFQAMITPYPLNAFHLVSREAVEEVVRHVQAPDALVAMEFLANMSAAAQGLYDVRLPPGQIRPLSLNLTVVAESGERKTAVHNLVASPLYEFDRARKAKYGADLEQYELDMSIWEAVNKGLRRQLTKLTQEGWPIDEVRRQLSDHAAAKPVKPRERRMLRQDVSARGTIDALEGDGESIAFLCDEGEIVIKGGAFKQTGLLNKAWDGATTLTIDRSNGVSIIARNPRVTVSFMLQPLVLEELLQQRGRFLRGSGHWARYLIAYPASTQGTRFMYQLDNEWIHLPKFHARMRELLGESGCRIDTAIIGRTTLEFDDDARACWLDFTNTIESQLAPLGYLHDIKDFASKSMEIAGRIAALLHVFSKQEGKISVDTLNRAVCIVDWHLHEFKRLFSPELAISQEQADAQALEHYLHTRYWSHNYDYVQKNVVLKNGPIRSAARLNAALSWLIGMERVWIGVGLKREQYINFNRAYFASLWDVSTMLPQLTGTGLTGLVASASCPVSPIRSNDW